MKVALLPDFYKMYASLLLYKNSTTLAMSYIKYSFF